jgi:hypothetical protein
MRARVVTVAALIAAVELSAADPALEVRIDPQKLGVEDTTRLSVTVSEVNRAAPPNLGEMVNLRVAGGPSTETRLSWVNGVATSSQTFTYVLEPLAVGKASVGPITVAIGETTLRSERIVAEVVPGSLVPAQPPRQVPRRILDPFDPFGDRRALRPSRQVKVALRQLVSQREVFVGQPVTATVVLDTTSLAIEGFDFIDMPSYPGWWAQRVELDPNATPEVVEWEGERFYRILLTRNVLIPLKAGVLTVPRARANIALRASSIFARPEVVERRSAEVEVKVKEQPPPPLGFTGAVGQLQYRAKLEPTEIEWGESAVVTIELKGTGNLPLVEAPVSWPLCADCETYPPEEESDIAVDDSGIHGSRAWRLTVLPRSWGKLNLEPVTLAIFDPVAGHYRHFTLGPLELRVSPPVPTPTPVPTTASGMEQGATEDEAADEARPDQASPPWRWIAGALLIGLVGGGLVATVLSRRRATNLPPRRDGETPAERARQLQLVLEQWWMGARESADADELSPTMDELRRDLELVRFAPGRADHSETIAALEKRVRDLVRSRR